MDKARILNVLEQHRKEILHRFHVRHLGVFGSAARDEMRADSDVDVLVEFSGPATFDEYMDLQDYLEKLLQRRVDLVTETGLKPLARPSVEKDLVRVA
jgi:predicted nucleotidyltransferase